MSYPNRLICPSLKLHWNPKLFAEHSYSPTRFHALVTSATNYIVSVKYTVSRLWFRRYYFKLSFFIFTVKLF